MIKNIIDAHQIHDMGEPGRTRRMIIIFAVLAVLVIAGIVLAIVGGLGLFKSSSSSCSSSTLPGFCPGSFLASTASQSVLCSGIGGFLVISAEAGITTYIAKNMTSICQYVNIGNYAGANGMLTLLSFPALSLIGQFFQLQNNPALTTASFPVLTYLGGFFVVTNNPNLVSLLGANLLTIASTSQAYNFGICGNAAGITFSPEIEHAAVGKPCVITTGSCASSSVTTCA